MILVSELKKRKEVLHFDQDLDIKETLLARNSEIIDIKHVKAVGTASYDSGLFLLDYHLTYTLTLPSSRSMKAVDLEESQFVQEIFIEEGSVSEKKELVDDNLLLILTGDAIDLEESAIDNILLSIPLQVLTDDEKMSDSLPTGNDWAVMTEEQYQAMKADKKEEASPFSALQGLFDG
ncbi:YceD family protein [Streptococcus iniae]|uniref:YceD family protein n=1 Tax=Streptococcus iniae TaxID=1346 RepID=UPI000EF7F0BC|nr:DUF177 domain-containing protein [Streptococcus iniae]RLU31529.1 DUF177 domain-containing protein [Streptococcus iniae]RLU46336.1 DUF177 domain-containing protein [Streptococcus iniae]